MSLSYADKVDGETFMNVYRAAKDFEKRQKLPADHLFTGEPMLPCCHPNIQVKKVLHGIHCKSLEHIAHLKNVARDHVTELLLNKEALAVLESLERRQNGDQ